MDKEELKKEAVEYAEKINLQNVNISGVVRNHISQAYLVGAEPREKRIAELEKENAVLERRVERAKECMKKLLFIINSDPANYNCKGLVQDAEDFIYNRTCNIRQQGQHCISETRCIMCDK